MKDKKINDLVKTELETALAYSRNTRQCEGVDDLKFLYSGVNRVIGEYKSGRCFLQNLVEDDPQEEMARATYFGNLHSPRRRDLASECETLVRRRLELQLKEMGCDHLAQFEELKGYDILAYDGHFQAHACHAPKDDKDRYRCVGGIYALNMRTGLVQRVVTTDFDTKKTNELRAFRDTFSPKAIKGPRKKTIAVVDKAYNDPNYWDRCRKMKNNGIYVISLMKEGTKILKEVAMPFDEKHAYNCGILSDSKITLSSGVEFRKVNYKDPETGIERVYISTVFDVPPGLIAYLYLWRWKIEKVFNTFKSGLGEIKAWANGKVAQDIQASLIAIAYNILVATKDIFLAKEGIEEKKLQKKWADAIDSRKRKAKELNRFLNPLALIPTKLRQLSLQFIRTFRNKFKTKALWDDCIPLFQQSMVTYL